MKINEALYAVKKYFQVQDLSDELNFTITEDAMQDLSAEAKKALHVIESYINAHEGKGLG